MYDMAQGIIAALLMIGILVVVHEAGHFVAAKIFGVGVPVFSVGMGPRLFGFVWRGTDYRVSALPIGGYVQMSGADPFGEEDVHAVVDPEEDFMRKPVWQRLIIMAAGPGVNLVLPFFVFTALLMMGRPDLNSRLGTVLPGSVAEQVGLQERDLVLAVGGSAVEIWHDVEEQVSARLDSGEAIALRIERDGAEQTIALPAGSVTRTLKGEPDLTSTGIAVSHGPIYRGPMILNTRVGIESQDSPAGRAGFEDGDAITEVDGQAVESWVQLMAALDGSSHEISYLRPSGDPEVEPDTLQATLSLSQGAYLSPGETYANPWGILPIMLFANEVSEGDPADLAGLQPGDRFLSLDGQPVLTFDQLVEYVSRSVEQGAEPRAVELAVVREGRVVSMQLTPTLRVVRGEAYQRPVIGVTSHAGTFLGVDLGRKYYTLVEAVPRAFGESIELVKRTATVLANVATRRSAARDNIGGPVAIAHIASEVAERGFFAYATLVGMFSVSLGVFNLLPVPVLDGGQIMFYAIEGLRGRPLSLQLRERFQMVGVVLLMVAMLFVIVNDISRVIGG